ncbi:hypothetical protein EWB00_007085 [Schistosoma japonicum]|uniref:Uncharacterized protein n=1 Tax=Schistosoma japonicum TaxID=6182 RepID=A0A4Z2DT50_SCHJA|nr:hypothetical protein EWB00_007085 [Schistosoma japonicum]
MDEEHQFFRGSLAPISWAEVRNDHTWTYDALKDPKDSIKKRQETSLSHIYWKLDIVFNATLFSKSQGCKYELRRDAEVAVTRSCPGS